jgi:hypothetical protein
MDTDIVEFATDKAQIAWEIGERVARIAQQLSPETPNDKAQRITFDSEYLTKGTYAIFLSGTVVGTATEGVFVVPSRSLLILKKLGIPYRAVA